MKSYIDYLQSGNNIQYLQRWLPWYPKDKNGNPKKEIPNKVSAGYIPGLIWQLQNKNKMNNEKSSIEVNKDIAADNSQHRNDNLVDIPAGIRDTVVKIGNRYFAIHIDFKQSS